MPAAQPCDHVTSTRRAQAGGGGGIGRKRGYGRHQLPTPRRALRTPRRAPRAPCASHSSAHAVGAPELGDAQPFIAVSAERGTNLRHLFELLEPNLSKLHTQTASTAGPLESSTAASSQGGFADPRMDSPRMDSPRVDSPRVDSRLVRRESGLHR